MSRHKPKKEPWYSPRAVMEAVKREVVAVPIGANSVRYVSRPVESNTLNRGTINPGYTFDEYRKNKKERKKEQRAIRNKGYWDESYLDEIEDTKPQFSFSQTRWSNWSYTTFLSSGTDNDNNLFVKEPENYLTPTVAQIKAKTNYWSPEDMNRIKELARVCYFKMIDDKDYIAEKFKDKNNCGISEKDWNKKKAEFDNVYTTFVPGFTPLEQAIAINYKIRDKESRNRRSNGADGTHMSTTYEFRRSNYADADINNQVMMKGFSREHNLEILDKISIVGDLGIQFKVEKEIGEKEVHFSDTSRPKMMASYDQLRLLDVYQRMLPHYRMKFLTKDLMVNVPVQTSENKQKIIILCDYSGSMNEVNKQIWVNAILIDRFKYVIKGEAEVFFSFFVQNPEQLKFHHVKNAEDVAKFWKSFSNSPGGSYTNMARIVGYVSDEVRSGRLHNLDVDLSEELPEILIINDGQDEVGIDAFPYKVNAISLMSFSEELKDLCVATGGKQVRVTSSDVITTYTKEGMQAVE